MIVPLTNFRKSMTADPREGCQLCQHFDNFTSKSLVPYKDTEDAYVSQSTFRGRTFLMYADNMYILGVTSGTARAELLKNTDIGVPAWSTPTNGADSAGSTSFKLFIEYKGRIYGASANSRIWDYDIAGTTFNSTTGGGSISYTNVCQGIVKADKLYFGLDNTVYVKDDSASIAVGITLPTDRIITSLCEWGNYLAIATRPLYSYGGNSIVYLWDRDTTLVEPNEKIDFGNLDLNVIENIGGYLVGVSILTPYSSSSEAKLVFSQWTTGTSASVFNEIIIRSTISSITSKQKYNGRMYFDFTGSTIDGTTNDLTGIWSVGINNGNFTVQMDRKPNNDTVSTGLLGFILVKDFMYISYLDGSSVFQMSKTNDQASYTATSSYRTAINDGMDEGDKPKQKELTSVLATYTALPGTSSSRQLTVKYKRDGYDWQTALTKTDDSEVGTKVITEAFRDTSGNPFESGVDMEFLIESKGVKVTGLYYDYKTI